MKKWLAIAGFTLMACSSQETKEPEFLIPKSDFIPLIVDLQILQEHYHHLFVRPDIYRDALDSASYFVFENYGATKQRFDQTLVYYSTKTDTLYAIYEAALDTLNFRINPMAAELNQ